ncbi:MAG: S1C family serine protease [Armatimonadota bacterium]
MRGGAGTVAAAVVLSLIVGVAGGVGGAWYYLQSHQPGEVPQAPERPGGQFAQRPAVRVVTEEDAIVNAVGKADPAVVKIVATTVEEPSNAFEFFFGGGQPRVRQGIGSGFLFDYNGRTLVLTNSHVVGGAERIEVQTREGHKLPGKVLGADPSSDVAILELETGHPQLPTAVLGDSDELEIGEWVVAIGHPFAFDHTVTVGVVSAKGERSLGPQGPSRNMIQTDAAINQGNSGGPLVNLAGEVIGINSMIYSPTGTSLGIGFAVPINDVKEIVQFLIKRGPWIGIETKPNSSGLARYLGLATDQGVLVLGVAPDGPAAAAGIQQGDVILRVDGQEIKNGEELREAIFKHDIGETVTMLVQRGDRQMQLSVTTGTIPENYFR